MEDKTTDYYPIPLGHNCMPVYYLAMLGLRTQALPFDWLLSSSYLAIDYAVELIDTNFMYFLADLQYDYQFPPDRFLNKFDSEHRDLNSLKLGDSSNLPQTNSLPKPFMQQRFL